MFDITLLWRTPEINPINRKARSIPALNPINMYGRVFSYSWFGFFVAFWSWYAFPPLLHDVIQEDLDLTQADVANSNITALTATLLVRLVAGTCCDKFGPRKTFAGCLLLGAIPTFLAGCVYNASGLIALRFFIGILGGSFVPCQVWSTGFFDKNVVGTANALTGGLGNAGGGITYFIMPAVYNSLVRDEGLSPHVGWRVAFVVPGIVIVATAVTMLLFCDDCPSGKWRDRELAAQENLRRHSVVGAPVNVPGELTDKKIETETPNLSDEEKLYDSNEVHLSQREMEDTAKGEVIRKPSMKEIIKVCTSIQTIMLGAAYFCSFGSELAINSILGNYYAKNFPDMPFQERGNWAAMFGLLNAVFRPLGGLVSDLIYRYTGHSLWAKKIAIHVYGLIFGGMLIATGVRDPTSQSMMFGLVAGTAFFLEGSNGLVFSLVPHVHPYANGIVSGFTGASGNFGGIIFAIIFRYHGKNYGQVFWIIGVMTMGFNIAISWIKPIPKGQIGGR
ncbi:major facilitator superfamily domain-containing protein [Lineolata rhizophorae]|uniref:Nitrate/nitrite transporter n=1 Tax=Lineolata rhizophorae TaxID=578093 RepID=A0A6A6P6Q8_9PEZI|nr:major facilitator superfamily domain-containing protein [Lineolata rhizophorae]